jgi:hypothetical protein
LAIRDQQISCFRGTWLTTEYERLIGITLNHGLWVR